MSNAVLNNSDHVGSFDYAVVFTRVTISTNYYATQIPF